LVLVIVACVLLTMAIRKIPPAHVCHHFSDFEQDMMDDRTVGISDMPQSHHVMPVLAGLSVRYIATLLAL
jgi:hypothetical protein